MTDKVSVLLDEQLPDFVKADHPAFASFMKAYYEWMENSKNSAANVNATIYETRKLIDYSDIDQTSEEFVIYFKNKFLPNFPEEILADKAKLIKQIREFYQKKGSEESLKFLFRVLYGQDIEIAYPKQNILIASDGKWQIPKSFKLTCVNTSASFNPDTLNRRRATGDVSLASCVIESAYKSIDPETNQQIFEVFVSNVNKDFLNGENLTVAYTADDGSTVTLFSEQIIGFLTDISIDATNRGLQYEVGNPVVISGGLSTSNPQTIKAIAEVGNVSTGQVQSVIVVRGGYGFTQGLNSAVTFTSTGSGTGAAAVVSSIDAANGISLPVNSDSINNYSSLLLSATFPFPNAITANANTTLSNAFSYTTLTLAPIRTIIISSGGSGYTTTPTVNVQSHYNTETSTIHFNNLLTSNTIAPSLWANTRQQILDLGKIAYVDVLNGGTGYNSSSDTIVPGSLTLGSGASFSFVTDGAGKILRVNVLSGGEGYLTTDLRINTSTGSGAVLRAYRYGEGQSLDVTVDDIGRIRSFNILNRGSGYISTPNVSLRVKDIVLTNTVGSTIGTISEGDIVYQGVSANNYTFYAKVDKYTNPILRVYDYLGSLNTSLNLQFTTFNAVATSVTTYGNGKARANASFLNGLVEHEGYFLNTDGFLSADKRLQDSEKYHNFSYVVIAEKALKEYRETLLDIIHPTGTKLLAYNQLLNTIEDDSTYSSNVHRSNVITSSLLTIDPLDNVGIAMITGAPDATVFAANSYLVISTGDRKTVKVISGVSNAYSTLLLDFMGESYSTYANDSVQVLLESNTSFFGDGYLVTTNNSNSVVVTGNTAVLSPKISAGDFIEFNIPEYPTNLMMNSEDYDNNLWLLVGSSVQNNMIQFTENVDYWIKPSANVSATKYTAPDGTLTAQKLYEGFGTTTHYAYTRTIKDLGLANQQVTYSVYAKAAERSAVMVRLIALGAVTTTAYVNVNLLTGALIFQSGITGYSITNAGNGWYRISITAVTATTGYVQPSIFILDSGFSNTYAGDGSSGIYVWGAQLTTGSAPGQYTESYPVNMLEYTQDYGNAVWTKTGAAIQQNLILYSDNIENDTFWVKSNAFIQKNLLLRSEDFNDATVWQANTGVVVTANAVASPFGSMTADTISFPYGGNGDFVRNTVAITGNTPYTFSVWAKSVSGNTTLSVDLQNIEATTFTLTTSWQRFTYTVTPAGNRTWLDLQIAATGVIGSASPGTVALWGAQLVQGSSAGDYVATTTTTMPVMYTGPTGALNAYKMGNSVGNAQHYMYRYGNYTSGATITVSCYAKAAEYNYLGIVVDGPQVRRTFDLANGTVATANGGIAHTSTITPMGNGWYRCSVTFTSTLVGSMWFTAVQTDIVGSSTFTGDGSSGIYIYGPQITVGASEGNYRSTTSAALPIIYSDPFGTTTANKLVEDTASSTQHWLKQLPVGILAVNQPYTFSTYVKSDTRDEVRLLFDSGISIVGAYFNLSSGTITSNTTPAAISFIGNGWYRCSISFNSTGDNYNSHYVGIALATGGTQTYTGNSVGSIYVSGSQFNAGGLTTYSPNYTVQKLPAILEPGPTGTYVGMKIMDDRSTGGHNPYMIVPTPYPGIPHTFSSYVKAGEIGELRLQLFSDANTSNSIGASFGVTSTGFVSSSFQTGGGNLVRAYMTPAGNGWFRCVMTGYPDAYANTYRPALYLIPTTAGSTSYTGNANSGIYLWGTQLEATPFVRNYVRSNTAATKSLVSTNNTLRLNVSSITGNTMTLNLHSVAFTSNNSTIRYMVYPKYENVSYRIISTT